MTLTLGPTAPFGRPTGGHLNVELPSTPAHLLFIHEHPRRLRGIVDGQVVIDSTRGVLLHETRLLPRWYVPLADVRADLLRDSATRTHCPFKGDARHWSLQVGDRLVEDALWGYEEPLPGAAAIAGMVSAYTERWDRWLEEDEEVIGHSRDPFHRVDARRATRHVTIRAADLVLAETTSPVAVYETGLPVRWYVPVADVRTDLLVRSGTTSLCPYKGVATYRSLSSGSTHLPDVAWEYVSPLPEALPALGCLAFDEAAGITVEVRTA